jgi:hypothetical protein
MNSCFDNYISLEGLSPEKNPRSGLYINRLPGITLSMFEALTNEERESTEEFFNIVYDRAKENFFNDVSNRLNDRFHVEKVINSRISGLFVKPFAINDSLEVEAGVEIEVERSKYSVLEIQTISIYSIGSPDPTGVSIRIIDNDSEALLWSKEVDLIEGTNIIDVFEIFQSSKVRVVYDPTQVVSYFTESESGLYKSRKCCSPCIEGNNVTQLNGGGLIVEFNTKCSIESFVCSRISQFKVPFWYYIGIELMTEALMSNETNCFTIDREKAKENLGFYEQEYKERIEPILQNLKVKDDSICFECKGSVTKAILLP